MRDVGADGNPVVPVDVVQGIVQQLATVSQHTSTATTAMIHLVSELAGLREMRTRDTTTMVEALAGASVRSGSPGVVEGVAVRTTDPAIRKLQEKDPEFPKYDGNPEHFLAWFVAVAERKELRQLSDQAAIIFATEALEGHARGTAGDGKRFESWRAFVKELKSKFCPQTVEYNVLHTLQSLRVQGGELSLLCESIRLVIQVAEGVEEC